jgi:hypothetical protein
MGFVAESLMPAFTAVGSVPEEAAENARILALAIFAAGPRPADFIVRLNAGGRSSIVKQPLDQPIALSTSAPDFNDVYVGVSER